MNNREDLSRHESYAKRMLDYNNMKYYDVYDPRIAEGLIKMKKWFYVIEKVEHYKTKKLVDCCRFEFDKAIFDAVKEIKKDIFGGDFR